MTKMLASVNSVAEAHLILKTEVDIIDLKQPQQGALGALPKSTIQSIVNLVNQKKPVSATIGDLPMQAEPVYQAVTEMADNHVDYIKIGFFPGGDWQTCINQLSRISQSNQLIAVFFADTQPDFKMIAKLKMAGFTGVMLDTMDKSKGSLLELMEVRKIKQFIDLSNQYDLFSGLAGSLKYRDVPVLMDLGADYLGFRGAICSNHVRTDQLDSTAVTSILAHFNHGSVKNSSTISTLDNTINTAPTT